MDIPKQVSNGFMCVYCKSNADSLVAHDDTLTCNNCRQQYPVLNNIPVLINESESIFLFSDFTDHKNLFFDISKKGNLIRIISNLTPGIGWNFHGKKNFKYLEKLLTQNNSKVKPRVLVVGGSIVGEGMSDFVKSAKIEIVEGDVSYGSQTMLIFDGHSIPYQNETFDCVIVQAVLEHVLDPVLCVREIQRILKPRGLVYAETPFMQQVHGGAYDFTRYTRSGHRKLFQAFTEIKSGVTAGSGTALGWSYEYFLLALFGHTNMLRLFVKLFSRFTGFWIKYFDYLTRINKRDPDGASGFYFIGQKSETQISDKELIEYYFKNQN